MSTEQGKGKHIHMVGIGGAGLSAIALVLLDRGFVVTGSDEKLTQRTADLLSAGAIIHRGHKASHIQGAQMVIYSSAVPDNNPELQAARKAGIPTLKRASFLGSLMSAGKTRGIAVAGTHGKSTTTGMIAHILLETKQDPTYILGDVLPSTGSNGHSGTGMHFVIEADEYDHMFLGLRPKVAVVTNIEHDHPDIFPTKEAYRQAFTDFVNLLPDGEGRLIICAEDAQAVKLLKVKPGVERIAYGIGFPITPTPGLSLFLAQDLRLNERGGTDFTIEHDLEPIGEISLQVPGEHNVNNALAAAAVAFYEGIPFEQIAQALSSFKGVERRFQVMGTHGDITIIDDYAHHPTEIRVTLAAAKERYPNGRVWAVWQPHTYSRVQMLEADFRDCFKAADRVVVLDVFQSRESDTHGVNMQRITQKLAHENAVYRGKLTAASEYLLENLKPGDVMVTLNAGDARVICDWVLHGLRALMPDAAVEQPVKESKDLSQAHIELDATVDQVQRLVNRLKDRKDK